MEKDSGPTKLSDAKSPEPVKRPVMDVKPRANESPTDQPTTKPAEAASASRPVEPPPAEPTEDSAAEAARPASAEPAKRTNPPKQPGSGVGLAITATVIIIFGIAALVVYAYLQSQ